MKQVARVLSSASEAMDLPADIFAGLPRMELTGSVQFAMEPHKGLLEYSEERVCLDSCVGKVSVSGTNLNIQQMNKNRITISGVISSLTIEPDE